jgi:divalent metal cation (Fe/Co/Zn/Cd) transporter
MPDPTVAMPTVPDAWVRRAIVLARITIGYNLIEGVVSVAFGASDDSLALFGFGLDSFIEVASAMLVLWRLQAERHHAVVRAARERRTGQAIAVLLVLLGLGAIAGSVWRLLHHEQPDTTLPGAIIAVLSLGFMAWLWRAKLAVATLIGSRTLHQDAACSFACIQLSCALLAGSVLHLLMPALWWADSVAAIAIALLILREGIGGLLAVARGEAGGCGCAHGCSVK